MFMSLLDFYDWRDRIAGEILGGLIEPTPEAISAGVRTRAHVAASVAAEFTVRFFDDIERHAEMMSKRKQIVPT